MMSGWTPESLNSLGAGAVALIVAAFIVWALVTERIVTGKQYRTQVARGDRLEEANHTLTVALIRKDTGEEMNTAILAAIRKEVAAKDTG